MEKEALKNLSNEDLRKKEKSIKVLIGLFVPIILGLLYFGLRDYLNGGKVDMPISIIVICSIGGLASLFPGLKSVREELRNRN